MSTTPAVPKPCPLCGFTALTTVSRFLFWRRASVMCGRCAFEGPLRWSKRKAVEAWNERWVR